MSHHGREHQHLPGWVLIILSGGGSTSDGVGFDHSLVVGDGPGGSWHDSFPDGVGSIDEKILGEKESVNKNHAFHIACDFKHLSINDYGTTFINIKRSHQRSTIQIHNINNLFWNGFLTKFS